MAILLVVLSGLLVLLVLLLAIPIDLAFQLEGIDLEATDAFKGQVTIGWLFGLVQFRKRVPNVARKTRSQSGQQGDNRPTKTGISVTHRNVVAVLRQAAFRKRVYHFVKDLLRATHFHQLRLYLRLGLEDPADTGMLWAFIGPLSVATQDLLNADVHIEPEFMDSALELHADVQMRLVLLQYLALAIAFALSPASVRAWRTLNASQA